MKELNATQKDSALHFLRDFECKASKAKLLPDLLLLQEEYGFGSWTLDEILEFIITQLDSKKHNAKGGSIMNCMVCGRQTKPSVPLCFCEDCRNNRQTEVQAKRDWWAARFKEIIAERQKYEQIGVRQSNCVDNIKGEP